MTTLSDVIDPDSDLWPDGAPKWAEFARLVRPITGRREVADLIFTRRWVTFPPSHPDDPAPEGYVNFTVEQGWTRNGDGPWHTAQEPMLSFGPDSPVGTAREVATWLREVADVMDGSAD